MTLTVCRSDTGARQQKLIPVERPSRPCPLSEDRHLLTEAEVQRSFRKLFNKDREIEPDAFEKAEALLDELRPESPLRHRLQGELEELRTMHGAGES
jgi:hypothetical protein